MEHELYKEHYASVELGKGIDICTGEVKETGVIFWKFVNSKKRLMVRQGSSYGRTLTFMKGWEKQRQSFIKNVKNGIITPAVLGGKIGKFCSQTNIEKINQKNYFLEQIYQHSKDYHLPFHYEDSDEIEREWTQEIIQNAATDVKKHLLLIEKTKEKKVKSQLIEKFKKKFGSHCIVEVSLRHSCFLQY